MRQFIHHHDLRFPGQDRLDVHFLQLNGPIRNDPLRNDLKVADDFDTKKFVNSQIAAE